MADLYRASALEKISSPEQLDKTIKISSPLSWLGLIGATLIVVATVIWSIYGTIPVTVSSSGIVSAPVSTNSIYSEYSGTVSGLYVSPGMELHIGMDLMEVTTTNGSSYRIVSDQVGTVSEVVSFVGDTITQNSEVIRVSPVCSADQLVVAYVPIANAKKISRGMQANIMLSAADSQSYGHMVARVINIDSFAASSASMSYVLGKDNNLTSAIANNSAVVAVACELYPDDTSANGFYWSNEKGKGLTVTNGSMCTVKVITEEVAPITKLFAKINEIWGG